MKTIEHDRVIGFYLLPCLLFGNFGLGGDFIFVKMNKLETSRLPNRALKQTFSVFCLVQRSSANCVDFLYIQSKHRI